jgi:chromate transporter
MPMSKVIAIFLSFLKVGIFGYGGGPAMVPLVQEEVVDVHAWLSPAEFTDALAMGNSLPGPIIVKLSVFIGYKIGGIAGSVAALLGVTFPGIVGMMILGLFFIKYQKHPRVQGLLQGVRPVVIAMLGGITYRLFASSVPNWKGGIILLVSFTGIVFLKIHPLVFIVAAGFVGTLFF